MSDFPYGPDLKPLPIPVLGNGYTVREFQFAFGQPGKVTLLHQNGTSEVWTLQWGDEERTSYKLGSLLVVNIPRRTETFTLPATPVPEGLGQTASPAGGPSGDPGCGPTGPQPASPVVCAAQTTRDGAVGSQSKIENPKSKIPT